VRGQGYDTVYDIRFSTAMMRRGDEPPPTLASVSVATLLSSLLVWPEAKLYTLVCSWHLPWAAVVILMLLSASVGVVLVIALPILVITAVEILWHQHRDAPRNRAAVFVARNSAGRGGCRLRCSVRWASTRAWLSEEVDFYGGVHAAQSCGVGAQSWPSPLMTGVDYPGGKDVAGSGRGDPGFDGVAIAFGQLGDQHVRVSGHLAHQPGGAGP